MKPLFYYMWVLTLCASCIEEFDDLPEEVSEPMLVVEGEIVSGQVCTFKLRRSATLHDISTYHYQNSMKPVDGSIYLECSDGSIYSNNPCNDGVCSLDVPVLDPDKNYTLHILTSEMGDYHSEPMKPLYAPEIASFTFDMPNNDGQIHFNVSTSDPNEISYFMWRYDEYYEVKTPLFCMWEYDEEQGFYVRDYPINQGWISITSNPVVTVSNEAYGNHAISEYTLFQKNNQELRFRTKYLAVVKQTAISVEEYEYYRLLRIQSTNSGGLFGAMPSELPSNLKRDDGKKAIGFVGIRGSVAEKRLVVDPKDVGYVDKVVCVYPNDDQIEDDPTLMIKKGWAISNYGVTGLEWARDWCVDCRKSYWNGGARLEKPAVWPF